MRQYQRLFEFENVRLRFTDDALDTVAELALQRKVGARGLRMILEDLMLEMMYHLPAQRKLARLRGYGGHGEGTRNQLELAGKSGLASGVHFNSVWLWIFELRSPTFRSQ